MDTVEAQIVNLYSDWVLLTLASEDQHMATLSLLDGSLKLTVFYEQSERDYEDDICICFVEDCDEKEKLFRADEVNIYLTPREVGLLVLELNRAMEAFRTAGLAE